jgi:D-alanyl-lipoteichoic acid acyltransferase DltB (MBOAT superfamily)
VDAIRCKHHVLRILAGRVHPIDAGLNSGRLRRRAKNLRYRKPWQTADLSCDKPDSQSRFSLLLQIPYFFAENTTSLLQFLGLDVETPTFSIILPLGISFYTFQTISYTVDVYRKFIRPERDFILYACYVTFYPQLVAGPILRAREVLPQLRNRAVFEISSFNVGLTRVLTGLFLKVVLADNLAGIVDAGFDQSVGTLSAIDIWTLGLLFGFQIYFDFSAYSHIALGCARMMGIHFPENFNFPYIATSPREFWRRWHISLSSWIRDYLYLPLTGEPVRDRSTGGLALAGDIEAPQRPKRNRDRALFESWAIMGLWHGANWTFVFWGLYHAALVYLHRKLALSFSRLPENLRVAGGFSLTLPLVMLGWIPFRAQNLSSALDMLAKVVDPRQYFWLGMRETSYLYAAVILAGFLLAYLARQRIVPYLEQHPVLFFVSRTTALTAMITLVFIYLRPINQFIYFQF